MREMLEMDPVLVGEETVVANVSSWLVDLVGLGTKRVVVGSVSWWVDAGGLE